MRQRGFLPFEDSVEKQCETGLSDGVFLILDRG